MPAPFDAKTLAALRGSIAKWEAIAAGTGADNLSSNCPLCALFLDGPGCAACPVGIAVDEAGCGSTPFEEWLHHQNTAHGLYIAPFRVHEGCAECGRIARAEVAFLSDLLP